MQINAQFSGSSGSGQVVCGMKNEATAAFNLDPKHVLYGSSCSLISAQGFGAEKRGHWTCLLHLGQYQPRMLGTKSKADLHRGQSAILLGGFWTILLESPAANRTTATVTLTTAQMTSHIPNGSDGGGSTLKRAKKELADKWVSSPPHDAVTFHDPTS